MDYIGRAPKSLKIINMINLDTSLDNIDPSLHQVSAISWELYNESGYIAGLAWH